MGFRYNYCRNAPFVHFASIGSEDALVVKTVDGIAAIPNQLTAIAKDIQAWTMQDGKVCDTCRIHVIKRAKPSDFIYTETEIQINIYSLNVTARNIVQLWTWLNMAMNTSRQTKESITMKNLNTCQ